jgi:hypothetical protein
VVTKAGTPIVSNYKCFLGYKPLECVIILVDRHLWVARIAPCGDNGLTHAR